MQNGHTIEIEMPSLTDVGSVANKPIVKVYDENGKDCTNEAKIEFGNIGKIIIKPREMTLTTGSATATNQPSLSCKEYTATGLVAGDYIVFEGLKFATQVGVGVSSNTIEYDSLVIRNANGEDVTKNYSIKITHGVLILY